MANEIISEDYLDIIVENELLPLFRNSPYTTITFVSSLVHIPVNTFNKCSLGQATFSYSVLPILYTTEATLSLEKSGIQQIQLNPNFNLYGQGVLIGIVDTGIDYQHEAFIGRDGTSKIVSIWDQTINDGGNPPQGFTYGTEYTKEQIDAALASEDPLAIVPSQDVEGHGTMIAGVIAGTPNVSQAFSGVVPDSQLVIVKLKPAKIINKEMLSIPVDRLCYQESDIMFGVNYLISVAQRLNRPLTVCIALGSSQGGHDGYGTLSRYLAYVTRLPSTAVVASAGNEGNTRRHFNGTTRASGEITEFELNVSSNDKEFFMELWQQIPFRLSIDIRSPTGEYIAPIYPTLEECNEITFIFEPSRLYVNNMLFDIQSGDQLILIRFNNAQEGIWRFGIRNIDNTVSEFNVWLPAGNLISPETYFLNSNPDITITSPANAPDIMTITAYDPTTDGIAPFSSRGYTRIGGIKPDLAAPGVNLTCPTLNNGYGAITGTGASAAHTTGITAMVLEWAVVEDNFIPINGFIIKELLIRGARRLPTLTYPNNVWGYGMVDVYGMFRMLI
ncbi:S8 family peptidase [Konateibacter massiliensis]|uniref:S8 family peptidase n=1 Tax=Konateibacter massiliensis TaxID=2002841 RepID=UPI001F3E853D|nr:S8 family peptidase [Konateibacter massiliensis]